MKHDNRTSAFMALRLQLHRVASAILRSDEEAEDALQELFVRTWQKPPPTNGYYFTALRNICFDALRRRHPAESIDEAESQRQQDCNAVENRNTIEHVRKMVDKYLTGMTKQVFIMYIYDQLDYDEIAKSIGITVEAARTAMSRARKTIRSKCEL